MPKIHKIGQIQSQTIIYILSLVIVAFVLIFGYQAISNISDKGDQVVLIQFQDNLKRDVNSLKSDYGSVKVREYTLPSGFDEICFVDLKYFEAFPDDSVIIVNPIMRDSVESGVKKNVFLFGQDDFQSTYVEDMQLDPPHFHCFQTGLRNAKLKIEGVGNAALLETPPNQKYCENADKADEDNPPQNDAESMCVTLDTIFGEGYKDSCCSLYQECC